VPADLGVPSASRAERRALRDLPEHPAAAIQINASQRFLTQASTTSVACNSSRRPIRLASFTSQFGTFDVSSLSELGAQQVPNLDRRTAPQYRPDRASAPQAQHPSPRPRVRIRDHRRGHRVASRLHQRGILSDEEFARRSRTARPALSRYRVQRATRACG